MKYIEIKEENDISILYVSREKALNALNEAVLQDLEEAFDAVDPDKTRCIILTGAGDKAFVAGADIAAMSNLGCAESKQFSALGSHIFRKIESFEIPVIAAVNGYALGGGCELAMACDFRIASENAVFGLPETSLGIMPGFGGTQRLMRLIPEGKAKEMIYAGTRIKAQEAREFGLVNAVYPADQLMDEVIALARRISRNAPVAVKETKYVMNAGRDMDLDEALLMETERFGECFKTEDQRTGMTAFLKKEKNVIYKNR